MRKSRFNREVAAASLFDVTAYGETPGLTAVSDIAGLDDIPGGRLTGALYWVGEPQQQTLVKGEKGCDLCQYYGILWYRTKTFTAGDQETRHGTRFQSSEDSCRGDLSLLYGPEGPKQ